MGDLKIFVDMRDNQTMSQYHVPRKNKVTFINADANSMLKIEAKKDAPWAFCTKSGNNGVPIKQPIEVKPGGAAEAFICKAFKGQEIHYKATIGTALPEDPIIIFDRHQSLDFDIAVSLALGLVIGASAAASILRLRDRKASQRADQLR